jgi:hypothetical protein
LHVEPVAFTSSAAASAIFSNRNVLQTVPQTLGSEGRWLRPKVLSTCHDGAGLQNVFRCLVAEATFTDSCWVESHVSSGAGGVCSVLCWYIETLLFLSSWWMLSLSGPVSGWYPSVASLHWIHCFALRSVLASLKVMCTWWKPRFISLCSVIDRHTYPRGLLLLRSSLII